MNRRRLLLMTLGIVGALIMGRTVMGLYRDALANRTSQIASLQNKLNQAKFKKAEAEANIKEWRRLGAQTLSMDANETTQRLRDDLSDLTKKAGLTKEKIDLGTVQPFGKNGVRGLTNCSVMAEGSMHQIVQFLYTLYRRPYMVKVKSMTLTHAPSSKDGPKGQLKMSTKIETLILPSNAKVPRITPADLKDAESDENRTKFPNLNDYQVLVDRKIWEKYVPPMPGKPAAPTPPHDAADVEQNVTLTWTGGANTQRYQIFFGEGAPNQPAGTQEGTSLVRTLQPGKRYFWRVDAIGEGGTTQGDVWAFTTKGAPPVPTPVVTAPPDPPKVELPPADGAFVLARVLSSPVKQQAVLLDQAQQDKRVEVGETLFGGTLIYVHPRGVVSERDGNLRFHAMGLQLQQAQPLTENDHPQIWMELKKLQAQAPGISERPG